MGSILDGSALREIDSILAETIKDEVGPELPTVLGSTRSFSGDVASRPRQILFCCAGFRRALAQR